MEAEVLRTERAVLSPPSPHDVEAIFAACQDAEIQRYTTVPSPHLRTHAEEFVVLATNNWAGDVEATWVIRVDGELAGMIGLHRMAQGQPELGYWMAREYRGRGLLTEAARAVIDWGFARETLRVDRIEWRAVEGNLGSARAARTLGFRYEGTQRQALRTPVGRADAWIAGLLRDDDRSPQVWPVLTD